MGLATIDPHSVKEHTEFHKIPKFGVNRPNNKQDTLECQNFTKKCTDLPDATGQLSGRSYISYMKSGNCRRFVFVS